MVAGLAGGIYLSSGSLFAASGRSRGSTAAWGPPLRRQTRRLEVVRRSLPRSVSALLPCRISGLLRLYLLQYGRQPLIVDDPPGCTVWILSNTLKPSVAPLNRTREPPVRVIHDLHLLAH